jgi:hypothetical protein
MHLPLSFLPRRAKGLPQFGLADDLAQRFRNDEPGVVVIATRDDVPRRACHVIQLQLCNIVWNMEMAESPFKCNAYRNISGLG